MTLPPWCRQGRGKMVDIDRPTGLTVSFFSYTGALRETAVPDNVLTFHINPVKMTFCELSVRSFPPPPRYICAERPLPIRAPE